MNKYNGFDLNLICKQLSYCDTFDLYSVLEDGGFMDLKALGILDFEELTNWLRSLTPDEVVNYWINSYTRPALYENGWYEVEGDSIREVDETDIVDDYVYDEEFQKYIVDNDLFDELGLDAEDCMIN